MTKALYLEKEYDSSDDELVTKTANEYNVIEALRKIRAVNPAVTENKFFPHAFGVGLLYSKEVNRKYYQLKKEYLDGLDDSPLKKSLGQSFTFPHTPDSQSHISHLRLSNHSATRTINSPEDMILDHDLIRNWQFGEDEQVVAEMQKITINGTRADKVLRLGKYEEIIPKLKMLKSRFKMEDKQIANLVKQNFCTQEDKKNLDNSVKDFINSFTYLLFGTEVVRNPASLLIHQMMLDLIINGENSWNDFIKENGLLPVAKRGAVNAARAINNNFSKFMPWPYKYPGPENSGSTITLSSSSSDGSGNSKISPARMLVREEVILQKWLQWKNPEKEKEKGKGKEKYKKMEVKEMATLLVEQVKEWYDVDLNHWLESKKRVAETTTPGSITKPREEENYVPSLGMKPAVS